MLVSPGHKSNHVVYDLDLCRPLFTGTGVGLVKDFWSILPHLSVGREGRPSIQGPKVDGRWVPVLCVSVGDFMSVCTTPV